MLVADEVTKQYGDLVALAPLSLTVPLGEMVALIGHNGSGKSTFLRMAAGLLEITGGTVTVAGAPAGTSDARAALSFLPDDPVLYDDLSVREHLAYVAALHGVDADEDEIDAIVERVTPLLNTELRTFERWAQQGRIQRLNFTHLLFVIWSVTQAYADQQAQFALLLGKPALEMQDYADAEELLVQLLLNGLLLPAPTNSSTTSP